MFKHYIVLYFIMFSSLFGIDIESCRHFLSRTSFSVTMENLSECMQEKVYQTYVSKILKKNYVRNRYISQYNDVNFSIMRPSKRVKEMTVLERQKYSTLRSREKLRLKSWWFHHMLTTKTPLKEKMTLFWHNHFTSSLKKVGQPALMYRQNHLFRTYALGNFGTLLHHIIKDPAMLIYLDNKSNKKNHPNENLARELLELFSLGEGNYNERDIKEVSRALTGYSIDRNFHFKYRKNWHDSKVKVFLNKKGEFNAHDIIDILLSKEETSLFIVTKLWKEFVSYSLDKKEIKKLALLFRRNHYEIEPLLYALFTSEAFTASSNRGTMIKSPVELIVGTLRSFGYVNFDYKVGMQNCRRLGQDLFDPPNVKGWKGGNAWIDTSTLLRRRSFLSRLTRDESMHHMNMNIFDALPINATIEEKAARLLLPVNVFITPGNTKKATLKTILLHPLYQLK